MYYSQQQEDRILSEKYLNYRNGFFIELGAMDGITYSNTLYFEKILNWTGILIEPTNQYEFLVRNRPNCINYNYAISEVEGEVNFLGNHALGGIVDLMHEKHRKGWNLDSMGAEYKVKSTPLYNLLNKNDIEKVDFFSVDVEGGELEVLRTYDWSIPVHVVLFEINHWESKNEECRNLLKEKGLEFDMSLGNNEVWINRNFNSDVNRLRNNIVG